jgi:hypothetical protein
MPPAAAPVRPTRPRRPVRAAALSTIGRAGVSTIQIGIVDTGRASLLVPILLLAACQPRLELAPTPRPTGPVPVIVVTEGGRLPTRGAYQTPAPTATSDLLALIATVVPPPDRAPAPAGPLPSRAPAPPVVTGTPRPPTPLVGGSGPPPRPTATPRRVAPPPTGTPASAGVPLEPAGLEPNDDRAAAVPLGLDQEVGGLTLHAPEDVDVFAVRVDRPNLSLVVTLGGRPPGRYDLEVVGPRGGGQGRQRVDGTVTLRQVVDVGPDLGTYYVYVRAVGALPTQGPYFISASLVGPTASATVSP